MPENTSDWPSKRDVATRLGISEKTIDRAVLKGLIKVGYRKVAGRRPIVVLRPEDVSAFEANSWMSPSPITPNITTPRLFLTIEESADYAGLPVSALQKFMSDGKLPFLEIDGGLRIRRRDLENL